jgi:hypothetical protein
MIMMGVGGIGVSVGGKGVLVGEGMGVLVGVELAVGVNVAVNIGRFVLVGVGVMPERLLRLNVQLNITSASRAIRPINNTIRFLMQYQSSKLSV